MRQIQKSAIKAREAILHQKAKPQTTQIITTVK